MFGSEVLEIAIGITFVYLLFSLVCTTLTEGIARLLAWRSRTLKTAIRNMITGLYTKPLSPAEDQSAAPIRIDANQLYENSFIRALAKDSRFPSWLWFYSKPSYIASRTFTLALFDTILAANAPNTTPDTAKDPAGAASGAVKPPSDDQEALKSVQDLIGTFPDHLPVKQTMLALLESRKVQSYAAQSRAREAFAQLKGAVDALDKDLPIRQPLRRLVADAEAEAKSWDEALGKARRGVEQWFDDSMERVTGWYTRKTRTVVILLAIVVTLAFNIDTLAIVKALHTDAMLRDATATAAVEFIRSQSAASEQVVDQTGAAVDAGSAVTPTVENVAAGVTLSPTVQGEGDVGASDPLTLTVQTEENANASIPITPTLDLLAQEIDKLSVPLGWVIIVDNTAQQSQTVTNPVSAIFELLWQPVKPYVLTTLDATSPTYRAELHKARLYRQEWPTTPTAWGTKLAGLLLTVVALSLGAPFWFDALGKLANLRTTGKAPSTESIA